MKKVEPQQKSKNTTKKLFSFRFLIVYFLFIFSVLSLFSSGTIESQDGQLYLTVARNIYYKHELVAAPNEYPLKNVNLNSFQDATGKWRAPGSSGYSIAMVPAVALSDVLMHRYAVTPPAHFPLESDWSVLFFASFTNCFIAAILAVILIFYGRSLGLTNLQSLSLSLMTIFATNIMPMAKSGFAQTLFTTALVASFYWVRESVVKQKIVLLFPALISFAVLSISYNQSFYLAVLPLVLYFILLQPEGKKVTTFLRICLLGLLFFLFKTQYVFSLLSFALQVQPKILFEGVWGFLFSSGKSVFLYSPILIILPVFWHKIERKNIPEATSFLLLLGMFLLMVGSAWIPNPVGRTPIWNGGMAWGPRYLSPLIPFMSIIVMLIIHRLNTLQRRILVYPLIAVGIVLQLVGSTTQYLLQYAGYPYSIFVGEQELSVYDYASFIPRYSPLLMLPKQLAKIALTFPSTINHGKYDVHLYDGFDLPLKTPTGVYRGFRTEGHIWYENSTSTPISTLSFTLANVPDNPSASESAHLIVQSNTTRLIDTAFPVTPDYHYTFSDQNLQLHTGKNFLDFFVTYTATPSAPHVIYIKDLQINGAPINLASIDYPDASALGKATTTLPYQFYGGRDSNPWDLWYMRARVSERTFDLWWIKNLYYWDRPQEFIWILFGLDCLTVSVTSYFVIRSMKNAHHV